VLYAIGVVLEAHGRKVRLFSPFFVLCSVFVFVFLCVTVGGVLCRIDVDFALEDFQACTRGLSFLCDLISDDRIP
jgi:hypothetical protein